MSNKYYPEMTRRCPHCLNMVAFLGCDFGDGLTREDFTMPSEEYRPSAKLKRQLIPVGLEGSDDGIITKFFRLADTEGFVYLTPMYCSVCDSLVIFLTHKYYENEDDKIDREYIIWPRYAARYVPEQVPLHIANDYKEAAKVLDISPKSSAALSRRCLQTVLQEAGNAKQYNLVDQIKTVKSDLPSYIAENIDAIRNIGNFAAHPIKEKADGCIVEVEPGEAEWTLDILDLLFDFYYVQPDLARKKREALNAKLKSARKQPLK